MFESQELVKKLNTHNWIPENDKTGILLIDLQEYFREICRPILDNLVQLLASARSKNIPLFFTSHAHDPMEDPGILGRWWTDLITSGSEEASLLPELEVSQGEVIIPKKRYSAFYGTDLENSLKESDIQDLVIGGVMTNLCCETTARDAFVRDFRIFFLADGTSTVSEDYHLATLKNLGYGFATLLTCDQVIERVNAW